MLSFSLFSFSIHFPFVKLQFTRLRAGKRREACITFSEKLDAEVLALARVVRSLTLSAPSSSKQRHGLLHLG